MTRIRKPIIVIGAGRSGTSIVAELMAAHPEVAYWGEPRPIWMYGHAYRADHTLGREDLSPRIARYIDRRFAAFLSASGRSRFMEKTPSNCLRIPFVHALYPDARIVNVIRDGRATVRSAMEIRKKPPNPGLLTTRLWETPLLDWPAYVPMFFRTVWRTRVLKKSARYWGAQPPGWRDWVEAPAHLAAAWQWRELVGASLRAGRTLPLTSYMEVRFEALSRDPTKVLREIMAFAELPESGEVLEFADRKFDRRLVRPWQDTMTDEQEREAVDLMQPLLGELGYG